MRIQHTKVESIQGNVILYVYIDDFNTEFSSEFGGNNEGSVPFKEEIRKVVQSKYPGLKINAVKVILGTMMIAGFPYHEVQVSAASTPQTTPQTLPYTKYQVQSGDTLYRLAVRFNTTIEKIKTLNNLKTDNLSVGQQLTVPIYTYTVVPGDSLAIIANKYKSTIDGIKLVNNLKSDMINVGQKLLIPVEIPNQPTTVPNTPVVPSTPVVPNTPVVTNPSTQKTYTVVAGDTLFAIASKYKTTVSAIKDTNKLTSDMLSIGQRLTIPVVSTQPATPPPSPPKDTTVQQETKYVVVGGDTLFLIAKKFNTTVSAIKERNHLSTDMIGIGQSIIIPVNTGSIAPAPPADTTPPVLEGITMDDKVSTSNASSYVISGKSEAGASVSFQITDPTNQKIQKTITLGANGTFSEAFNLSSLKDGQVNIQMEAVDAAGNKSVSYSQNITKDSTPPTGLTVLGTDKMITINTQKEFRINGTSNENGAIVEITATDGQKVIEKTALVVNKSYDIPLNLEELSDGTIKFIVRQRDPFGNSSEPQTLTQIKDTISNIPVITKSTITNNNGVFTYVMQGNAEPNSDILVSIAGATGRSVTPQQVHTMKDGSYTLTVDVSSFIGNHPFITVKQIDAAGNESEKTMAPINSYVVGAGDTLWKIANRFGTNIDEIKRLNQLESTMLAIGQELKLPIVAGLSTNVVSESEAFNMGYLYFGSSADFINTMNQTGGTINVVSPTYFDINKDGTLKLTAQTDRYFIAGMQKSNVRVVPFLSNHWDQAAGIAALKNREQLSQQIADEVTLYNLDGINVDIENVTAEYRDEYTDFVRLLREKLPEGKEVSVAVAANPTGVTTGWHGSYDYNQLAKYSDYLMVMSYDESYPGSAPGPVASIGFVEKSIQFALNQGVANEKIVLGIGHYGRYWKEGDPSGGQGISNQQISELVKKYNGTVTYDTASKSPKATFTIKANDPKPTVYGKELTAGNYIVWFENEQSMKAKYDLVAKYGIKGTGNWGVDQENLDFWKTFSTWISPTADGTVAATTP